MVEIIGGTPKESKELTKAIEIAIAMEELFSNSDANPTIVSQAIRIFSERHNQRMNNLSIKDELEASKELNYEPIKPTPTPPTGGVPVPSQR